MFFKRNVTFSSKSMDDPQTNADEGQEHKH